MKFYSRYIRRYKGIISASLILALILGMTGCGPSSMYKYGRGLDALNGNSEETDQSSASDYDSLLDDYFGLDDSNESDDTNNLGDSDSTSSDVQYASENNPEFEKFLDEYFEDSVTGSTISYNTTIKNAGSFGIDPPEATLGDSSTDQESLEKEMADFQDEYDKLLAFEDAALTEDERFTYDNLKADYEMSSHIYDNVYLYEPFSPGRGIQANLPSNFTDYIFEDKSDVEDYITLLNQVRDYFKDYIDFEYTKSEKGFFMSDKVADEVIKQCDEFTAEKKKHFLIEVFSDQVDEMDFLTDAEKKEYKKRDKEAVLNSVIPAFEDLKKALTELKGTGKNDKGICYWEGGKELYENYYFPVFSGSSKTPDEEITYMENRASNLVLQLQTIAITNSAAYNEFADQYQNLYEKYDKMEASDLIDYMMDNCMDDYPELDKIPYTTHYLDKPLEKIMENTLAYYRSPPIDDEENNLIYVNGAHADDMWVTLAHEGCPGHMFQNAYFQSTKPNKVRAIQGNLGYAEGWAVYSSYNSLYQCDFDTDYDKEFAQLAIANNDLNYLVYGRLDLGVNYEGWDVKQVEDYLDKNGFSKDYAEDMMVTLIGDPGLYLSYSVGYYEMLELRERAENELGSKFDVKEFHKAILEAGPCQFKELSTKVDKYIEENR